MNNIEDSQNLLQNQEDIPKTPVSYKKSLVLSSLVGLFALGSYGTWSHHHSLSLSSDSPDDSFSQYLQFISKYQKTSSTEEEFYSRFEIFKSNYQRILSHNAIEDSGFTLEINKFADLSDEEFIARHTGLVVPSHKTDKMRNWTVP
jgi:hypothetical protein